MLTPFETILAGSISGFAGVIICHPFDSIRTRLQASKNPSTSHVIKSVVQEYGIRGFYKGFIPPFVAQGVYKSVIFTVNNYVYQQSNNSFLSGMIAGAVNSMVVCPVELVRTRQILAVTSSSSASSVVQVLNDIIKSNGYRGLWSTLGPTVIRDGPGLGFYFISFNYFKLSLSSVIPDYVDTIWTKVIAGMFAGISFWIWALPIDTIKTVIEANIDRFNASNTLTIIKNMYDEGGILRFYRGWIFAFGRGIPAASITLTVYDSMSEYILRRKFA
jgi:solute carrier family 25 carnitine/acylcarnitine transporter 20/29